MYRNMNKKISSIIIGLITIIALIIFGVTLKRAVIAAPDEQEIYVATSTETYETKETIASYPSIGLKLKNIFFGESLSSFMVMISFEASN